MKTNTTVHKLLSIFITLCLISPAVALAGKSGKKNFKEGVKYEQQQQWDQAAQQYALAVAAEPNNAEYKLYYLRALQQASLMYMKRGDTLAEQGDFSSAFNAYRTAYNYDQGNDIAKLKMERMLEQQKNQASGADPVNVNKVANVRPVKDDIQVLTKPRSKDVAQSITFKETKFKTVVLQLSKQLGLNVVFDESVKDVPVTVDLTEVTVAKALDIIFKTYKYAFEQVDRRTIIVYADNTQNRPKFENFLVKTFYLGNITAGQARNALAQMLPTGRQIASLDQGNNQGGSLLIIKATATELQLVQDILNSLDKNKNEVVLDVDIYEVSHDSLLHLGNQIATTTGEFTTGFGTSPAPGLNNFGGIGQNIGTDAATAAARAGVSAFIPGVGALIGLPPSSLSLLQAKGNSKLLYKTNIHVLDGQKNITKVGRSVPVRVGTTYPGGFGGGVNVVNPQQGGAAAAAQVANQALGNLFSGGGFGTVDNIQYRDVGLVIETKPTITTEGYVEMEMKFETSDVLPSGLEANLTPTFTQRSLTTTARIQDGITAVVAGVNQETKGDSRAGIPVIGMLPILGRLFTAPREEARKSDIVITVTPHIVRSQGINEKDYLAKFAGQAQAGPAPSIEDVIYRATQEEEGERRLIAQGVPQSVPLNTPAQVPTEAAGFNQTSRQGSQTTTIQPVVNTSVDPRAQRPATPRPIQTPPDNNIDAEPAPTSNQIYQTLPDQKQQDENISKLNKQNNQSNQNNQNNQADQNKVTPVAEKGKGKEDEEPQLDPSYIVQPRPNAAPAELVRVKRPENVEKDIAKMRAEAENASKTVSQPISLSLSPRPIRQQLGKTFAVTVEVSSQAQMTGADIALKFDDKKLKFKSVSSAGGIMVEKPDFEMEKGNLVVRLKHSKSTPVSANGRLITIEFVAIAEGQTEIAFNNGATQLRMPGNASIPATGSSTQVIISPGELTNVNGR
jgi:general secretion pathway protein D